MILHIGRLFLVLAVILNLGACFHDKNTDSSGAESIDLDFNKSTVLLGNSQNNISIEVKGMDENDVSPLDVNVRHVSGPAIDYDVSVENDSVTLSVRPAAVTLSESLKLEVTVTQGESKAIETIEFSVVNEQQVKDYAPFDFSTVKPNADHTCVAQEGLEQDEPESVAVLQKVYDGISIPYAVEMKQYSWDDEYWYVLDLATFSLRRFKFDVSDTEFETLLEYSGQPGTPFNFEFHPDFINNGKVYVFAYVEGGGLITEYTWDDSVSKFDADSAFEILRFTPHETELEKQDHHGGQMHFGPDGYLYAAFGDLTRPENFNDGVQDMGSFAGKMIRIDVDGGTPYAIPADNPFVGAEEGQEIYALGFRHPWKWSFDSLTGDIWLGDVGWVTKEEVNIVVAGGNYGWPIYEGSGYCPGCPQKDQDHGLDEDSVVFPVHEYGTDEEGPTKSVTGGFVYRGSDIPELYGKYVFGDFIHGKVWALSSDDSYTKTLLDQQPIGLAMFSQDNQGELYTLDIESGDVYKLVSTASVSNDDAFPSKLSETGCVNVLDPLTPPAGAIPFDVQVPLWTDASEKARWLFLSKDSKIGSLDTADGDLDYPVGTVMVKHFKLQGKMIETRLLIHRENGEWSGYSYEWNDEETDASLLSEAKEKEVGEQVWTYPSRSQCLQCHTEAAGRSLGPTTAQLNTFHDEYGEVKSQLEALKSLDVFNFDIDESIQYPHLDNDDAAIADKARAYLDSNCSGCHRPGGSAGRADIDLRAGVAFSETNLCNATTNVDNLGIDNGRLIVPGDIYSSILAVRISTREEYKMPLIGSNIVHDEGVMLVNSWIDSLVSCDE